MVEQFDSGGKVQRQVGRVEAGLGCEVMTDDAVVVIVSGAVMTVLVLIARMAACRRCCIICVMMVAAVVVAVRMPVRVGIRGDVLMRVVVFVQQVHAAVADERNSAVDGEQAPANKTVNAGEHAAASGSRARYFRVAD